MSRYKNSSCRRCRREAQKLYLKGDRCYSEKCAIERRNYSPGQHGKHRSKLSDYGLQLREKQKVRYTYGLTEKQFKLTYERASRLRGITGFNLLISLETRLDNTVYKLGFASSRAQARHWISHGHFLLNDKKVNIPSLHIKLGDIISICEKSRDVPEIKNAIETSTNRVIPDWLERSQDTFVSKVKLLPTRKDITTPIQEQLIVEFYSR